jgi:capsular exopolysaccharide synthesis family protein
MSKLFEALTRGQDGTINQGLELLLEGQVDKSLAPHPEPLAAPPVNKAPATPPVNKAPAAPPVHRAALPCDLLSDERTVQLQVSLRGPILPFDGSHWKAGEQYRILRTKIVHHPAVPRVIVISSAGPSDGKSVTAVNLAGVLALKSEARVLLIDADFRRSTVCNHLGFTSTPGLAEVLTTERRFTDAMVRAQQIPNLHIMPAGESVANPAELLDSPRWKALIAFVRAEFEYVIIDSPPIGAVADYELIQAVSDGAILVLRPDHSNRQSCFNALSLVKQEKLLGVVLNCLEEWFLSKDPEYSSYYHYSKSGPTGSAKPARGNGAAARRS